MLREDVLSNGTKIKDSIEVIEYISCNKFFILYKGWHSELNQNVLIEEYLPEFIATRKGNNIFPTSQSNGKIFKDGIVLFEEEAKNLKKLNQSNIISIIEYFKKNNTLYIIKEYINALTLKESIANKELSQSKILDTILPLLDTLEILHKKNISHGAINSDNIVIQYGKAKFINILNRAFDKKWSLEKSISNDLFSIGEVLYEMVTHKKPPTLQERIDSILSSEGDPIKDIVIKYQNRYSKDFLEGIVWAMHFKQEKRVNNVKKLREKLTRKDKEKTTKVSIDFKSLVFRSGYKMRLKDYNYQWQYTFELVENTKKKFSTGLKIFTIIFIVTLMAGGGVYYADYQEKQRQAQEFRIKEEKKQLLKEAQKIKIEKEKKLAKDKENAKKQQKIQIKNSIRSFYGSLQNGDFYKLDNYIKNDELLYRDYSKSTKEFIQLQEKFFAQWDKVKIFVDTIKLDRSKDKLVLEVTGRYTFDYKEESKNIPFKEYFGVEILKNNIVKIISINDDDRDKMGVKDLFPSPQEILKKIFTKSNVEEYFRDFEKISSKGSIDEQLKFYNTKVSPYFHIPEATHYDISQDIKSYISNGKIREYQIKELKIINRYIKDDDYYADVIVTMSTKISNGSKSKNSVNHYKVTLLSLGDSFKITAFKSNNLSPSSKESVNQFMRRFIKDFQNGGELSSYLYAENFNDKETIKDALLEYRNALKEINYYGYKIKKIHIKNISNDTKKVVVQFDIKTRIYNLDITIPYIQVCTILSRSGINKIKSVDTFRQEKDVFVSLQTDINNISINIKYTAMVSKGKDIKVKVSMTNKGKFAQTGGLSISFPNLNSASNISSKKGNFKSITPYSSGSKLWSGEERRTIYSRYLMVEGWQKKWARGVTKTMEVTIPSYKIRDNKLDIYIRGILVSSQVERVIPSQGTKGQQGYQNYTLLTNIVN